MGVLQPILHKLGNPTHLDFQLAHSTLCGSSGALLIFLLMASLDDLIQQLSQILT